MPKPVIDWHSSNATMIGKFEIEIEYVHNLKELYKRLYFWLDDNGWKDIWGAGNYEVRYWQRDLPGGGMYEHHIWWRAWKNAHTLNHKSSLFKYFFKINYQTIAASKKEIMHKGKKWKMDKSNTILRVETYLIVDWDEGWDQGFLKSLHQKFKQWSYKDKIKAEEDKVAMLTSEFQNQIKNFLEITKDQETSPNVYPPNMLP